MGRDMDKRLRVQFISVEDDGPDLSVNFALWPRAHDTLMLLRSPHLEHMLAQEDRGISVPPLDSDDQAVDLLQSLTWGAKLVVVTTQRHQYRLDVSEADQEDVNAAKQVLQKMAVNSNARIQSA